jgi:phage gp36-like protein
MSVTTLTYTNTVDGVPTDADSVVLTDPTATFGVQRKDNNAIVVSAGTPFVHISAGNYAYSFIDPAPNLLYRYYIKVVIGAIVQYIERETSIAPAAGIDLVGRYASSAGMSAKFGVYNILAWAAVDNQADDTQVQASIQDAINKADSLVDSYLAGGPYLVPFAGTPLTGTLPSLVESCANELAGVLLYEARGLVDYNPETGRPEHRLRYIRDRANAELARIKTGRTKLVTSAGQVIQGATNEPFAGDDRDIYTSVDPFATVGFQANYDPNWPYGYWYGY